MRRVSVNDQIARQVRLAVDALQREDVKATGGNYCCEIKLETRDLTRAALALEREASSLPHGISVYKIMSHSYISPIDSSEIEVWNGPLFPIYTERGGLSSDRYVFYLVRDVPLEQERWPEPSKPSASLCELAE